MVVYITRVIGTRCILHYELLMRDIYNYTPPRPKYVKYVYYRSRSSTEGPGKNPKVWGSRLKMLRTKCYSSYCLLNSFSHHILSLNLTCFPDYVRNPDVIPSIQCDVSVLEWLAIIVLLSSLLLSGWVLQILEYEKIPSIFLRERRWGSNPRPHCS